MAFFKHIYVGFDTFAWINYEYDGSERSVSYRRLKKLCCITTLLCIEYDNRITHTHSEREPHTNNSFK